MVEEYARDILGYGVPLLVEDNRIRIGEREAQDIVIPINCDQDTIGTAIKSQIAHYAYNTIGGDYLKRVASMYKRIYYSTDCTDKNKTGVVKIPKAFISKSGMVSCRIRMRKNDLIIDVHTIDLLYGTKRHEIREYKKSGPSIIKKVIVPEELPPWMDILNSYKDLFVHPHNVISHEFLPDSSKPIYRDDHIWTTGDGIDYINIGGEWKVAENSIFT